MIPALMLTGLHEGVALLLEFPFLLGISATLLPEQLALWSQSHASVSMHQAPSGLDLA